MSSARCLVVGVVSLLLPFGSATAAPRPDVPGKVRARLEADGDTPFQRALKKKIKERGNSNKDVPAEVVFGQLVVTDESDQTWERQKKDGTKETLHGRVLKATATTKVILNGPYQAHDPGPGQAKKDVKWPDLKVRQQKKVGDKGDFEPDPDPTAIDDYTLAYYEAAQKELGQPCEMTDAEGNPMTDAEGNPIPGVPLWKGYCKDADGNPDYTRGLYDWQGEPREVEIEENIIFTFPEAPSKAMAGLRSLAAPSSSPLTNADDILMGFTYKGPGIDYTIGDKRKVCVKFLGCATIYDIRAGFALDWDLGLRLPGRASFSGFDNMVAGRGYSFSSWVTPADWEESQYSGTGVEANAGNEYVLGMDFFAGAKAFVLGNDVCPYCQYVEFTNDYSKSFATPFGNGSYFPIPSLQIEVKRWDYGIVALAVGLDIQPLLGSTKITATAQGTALPGTSVLHSQPGQPSSIPVNACIAGGSHTATYQLSDFRYWFNEFLLRLGAYMDFQVLGYGAWNPIVPIIDLDLSALSEDMSLGKHVQCDWKFDCNDAGPANVIGLTSSLVDVDPPTTSITVPGPSGRNTWYVSDVPVSMSAVDNPGGCGIGVQLTEYSLDIGAWGAYAPFTLAKEGITAVSFRSRDTDGNEEPANRLDVKIDKSPPIVSGAPTRLPNVYDWYNDNVVVHFTAVDLVSGIDTITPDITLAAEAFGQSTEGSAMDVAGNSASFTVKGINIDKTPPAIVISSPDTSQTYSIRPGAKLAVRWTAIDSLSFVRTEQAQLDGLGVDYWKSWDIDMPLIGGGNHFVVVSALDYADNFSEKRVDFVVDVDIDGLLATTAFFCANGGIKTPGTCKSLTAKATAAKGYIGFGKWTDARGVLGAYLNELDAQRAKGVLDPRPYELLRVDANWVLAHYVLNQIALTASY